MAYEVHGIKQRVPRIPKEAIRVLSGSDRTIRQTVICESSSEHECNRRDLPIKDGAQNQHFLDNRRVQQSCVKDRADYYLPCFARIYFQARVQSCSNAFVASRSQTPEFLFHDRTGRSSVERHTTAVAPILAVNAIGLAWSPVFL